MPAVTLAELEAQRLSWGLRVFVPAATEYASATAWHVALSAPGQPALRLDRTAPYQLHGGVLGTTIGTWRVQADALIGADHRCALCGESLTPLRRPGLHAAGLAFHLACLPAEAPALASAQVAALLAVAEERPLFHPLPPLYGWARHDSETR